MVGRDGSCARESGGEEGVVSEEVDLAGQSAGSLEEGFLGGGVEEGELGAGEAESVGEVVRELVTGQGRQVIADDDALRQSLVDGHGESPAELGLTEQQETEAVFGVHVVVGQQAEIFEDLGSEVLGFVDDQDRAAAALGDQSGDLALDLAKQ
jgi:hypothetical protein